MDVYGHPDLAFVRGRGCTLWAADGTPHLDLVAGIAVCGLGHCHPHLVAALREQAGELWHVSNLYHVPEQQRLAERLVAATFADRVFLAGSGTEAVEATIKLARRFQHAAGRPERDRILTAPHAFHGRTLGALSATGNPAHLAGCGPRAGGFATVGATTVEAFANAVDERTAAILIEPVQGEGGVRPVPSAVLRGLRRLCDEHGLLLLLDEVQTGFGRTGRLLAHEHADVVPDAVALAKGMGGGFPVGACLATERAAAGMTTGTHGSTFGGNPLACRVANAVLDVLESPGFLELASARGARLRAGLEAVALRHPDLVAEVRGVGLMLGLVVRGDGAAADLQAALRRRRVLVATAGPDVVRLVPPLVIDEVEIDRAVAAIDASAGERAAG